MALSNSRRFVPLHTDDFGVFLTTGPVLNLTPDPDAIYILGRSMAQGRGAGIASVPGISTARSSSSSRSLCWGLLHRHGSLLVPVGGVVIGIAC